MSVLDRAKAHFAEQKVRQILVPEWGEPGQPLVVHVQPMTMRERARIYKPAQAGDLMASVEAVILCARDATGARIFTDADKHALSVQVDPRVVTRLAAQILGDDEGEEEPRGKTSPIEDAEKN